jgi:DNA-binding transcriptional regulator YiaG
MMSIDVQKLHDAVLLMGDAALEIADALAAFTKKEKLVTGDFRRPGDPKPLPPPGLEDARTAQQLAEGDPAPTNLIAPTDIELWVLACCNERRNLTDKPAKSPMPIASELYDSFEAWCKATDTPCPTLMSFVRRFNKTLYKGAVVLNGNGPGQREMRAMPEQSYVSGRVLSEYSSKRRSAARRTAKRSGYDLEHWSRKVRTVRRKAFEIGRPEMARMLGVATDSVSQWEAGVCFANGSHRKMLELIAHSIQGVEPESWKKDSTAESVLSRGVDASPMGGPHRAFCA